MEVRNNMLSFYTESKHFKNGRTAAAALCWLNLFFYCSTVFLWLQDRVFSFQNNPKDLDLSYKTDLDLWDCLGRVKLVLLKNFTGLIQLFEVILEGQKPRLTARLIWYFQFLSNYDMII